MLILSYLAELKLKSELTNLHQTQSRLYGGLTLAITWPQGVLDKEDGHVVSAQVHCGVRHSDYP
jgi:hypothetical protein